jgi:hypothetical protein
MSDAPVPYACNRFVFISGAGGRLAFDPLPTGKYRVRCEVRAWTGTGHHRPVSFAITVNDVQVQKYESFRVDDDITVATAFSRDDVVNLFIQGSVIALVFEAAAAGEVQIEPA